jgi:DNA-binding transcriptional MerR regulator
VGGGLHGICNRAGCKGREYDGIHAEILRTGGLIVAKRHENGRRYFDEEDVKWLKFIHHMRSTDMPIADLARYVKLRRRKVEGSQQELLLIMKKHERHLIEKMAHYQSNLDLVRYKISMYEHELKDRDTDLFELFKERRCNSDL